MKLTDAERAEFIALAGETLDPEFWDEDDLPLLRANKKKFEKAEGREEETFAAAPLDSSREEWETEDWPFDQSLPE
jgi:hypothetical protein